MNRAFTVGIVGCGQIARAHHAAYQQSGQATIIAVCDEQPGAAEKFAADIVAACSPSPAHLARAIRPDVVSICTPPAAHLDNCRPFLEHRIPILSEKPLAANLPDAETLTAAVRQSGTMFMTGFCHRFHPPILELKRLLDTGVLGRPLFFRNIFAGYFPLAGNHRADPAISGGGCLMDNGAHSIDLFRFLMGEPTEVQAMIGTIAQAVAVEDFQMIHLSAGGTRFGEISSSYSLPLGTNYVELYAENGTAVVSYFNPGVPPLSYRLAGANDAIVVPCADQPDRFAREIAHFLECVRSGSQPSPSVEDGLRVNQIIAAAYQSARTGLRLACDTQVRNKAG